MALLFPLLLLIFLVFAVIVGSMVLKRLLPKDHPAQKYLSDDVVESALAWLFRNIRSVSGWLLVLVFTIITLVYS